MSLEVNSTPQTLYSDWFWNFILSLVPKCRFKRFFTHFVRIMSFSDHNWTEVYRSKHPRCSIKKLFLKISQYSKKKPVFESLFDKVAALKVGNFCDILRTPICERLPLSIVTIALYLYQFDWCNDWWITCPNIRNRVLMSNKELKWTYAVTLRVCVKCRTKTILTFDQDKI